MFSSPRSGQLRSLAAACLLAWLPVLPAAWAGIDEKVTRLSARSYCVNAGGAVTWDAAQEILKEMEIETTLSDSEHRVITTQFIKADAAKLRRIASNARPFYEGRFTLKLAMEEVTPAYTRLNITLQARQQKIIGKSERLLKSRGTFEKFLAYRINQLALGRQFPSLYDLRLGFELVPNLETERYRIRNVEEHSPAGEAGFRDGDELMAMGGEDVSIRGAWFERLLDGPPEKTMVFRVRRGKQELDLPLQVIRVKEPQPPLGIRLDWDAERREFRVASILAGSRAERAGLRAQDVLVRENGVLLHSWSNYYRALVRGQGKEAFELQVRRGQEILTLSL